MKNVPTTIALMILVLAPQFDSSACVRGLQAEPVLVERYFGDQTALTFAALDAIFLELMKHPDARATMIIYNGLKDPPGLPYRHALGLKDYFRKRNNASSSRIDVIFGMKCELFSVDLWLVPRGAPQPVPRCTLEGGFQDSNESGKFDEYLFDYEHPDGTLYADPYLRLATFAKALIENPNTTGYIVGYAQQKHVISWTGAGWRLIEGHSEVRDKRGTGKRIANREKRIITRNAKIAKDRIVTIDGGYRTSQMIELWILPTGAPEPNPTPAIVRDK